MAKGRTVAKLRVRDFACFIDAAIEIGALTIVVGPQASGKSLLARLIFFFGRIPERALASAEQGDSLFEFRRKVELSFVDLFPPSAWGRGKFRIEFSFGAEKLTVIRRTRGRAPADTVQFLPNENLRRRYVQLRERFEAMSQRYEQDIFYSYYGDDRLRSNIRSSLTRQLNSLRFRSITFSPAGRSFFTSMGKAVSAFESGGLLDEITLEFGRRFMGLRGQRFHLLRRLTQYQGYPTSRVEATKQKTQAAIVSALLSGEFIKESDNEFFITSDGRKVPFANLSSGQQELFPLLAMVLLDVHEQITSQRTEETLSIVEEPEAHLFPASQSRLVELIASSINFTKSRLTFFITTHSPYVLAKVNNLLKADEIFAKRNPEMKRRAAHVVDPNLRITRAGVRAYSIRGNAVRSIMSHDGLIVADYIDSISESIADQFDKLLEIQYG